MSAQEPDVPLSPIKQALLDLRVLRAKVQELEAKEHEPLAIVGMSIRAPGGVETIAGFAELLWAGRDAVTEVPAERWPLSEWFDASPDKPGKMSTRHGAFLSDVAGFDAEFFGIAPLEAASMDPQQRIVLELSWEALEDAGYAPSSLAGTRSGIYLGIANSDYGRALFARPELIDPYFSPGTAFSVAAGRVAYVLGLHGPAIALDTACSSSLTALHLACQGLRHGDCDLALVGGINLILTPELSVNFSKAGMMSPDGRCRTFDEGANGYVRGEGGGIVVVRRLRDAIADGDRILCIVRGSAVNQDGRSNGLTAPNGPAQRAVVQAALRDGGIRPGLVGYVEAHGTGTPLGDPIEIGALASALSEGRDPAAPLVLGSVKTNVGHLEAAAGIAGIIKTTLALGRREIPPHLHLTTRSPFIDWNALPMTIPSTVLPWTPIEGRRIAGVSSFGFSGTNAHVVLEEAPVVPRPVESAPVRPEQVLTISARDPLALRASVERYRDLLSSWGGSIEDLCYTASVGRTHFGFRVSALATSVSALAEALSNVRVGAEDARAVASAGEVGRTPPRVAFLFPGQGPQYAGMGRELYDTAPAYRRAFDDCGAALERVMGRPLLPIVFPTNGDPAVIHQTENAQPAMFAVEYALATLWRSWGIEPAAVMGHSFGEYAAACVAGVLTLDDAARMVVARGKLTTLAPGNGLMVVVEASEEEALEAMRAVGGPMAVAAVNGPSNTVISGERKAIEEVAARFAARRRRTTALAVSHAFHSPMMDPVLDGFEREIGGASYSAPTTTLISNLTAQAADLSTIGRARYWRDHLRQPVRFADSIKVLAAKGITHYIEMSPHPVLLGMGADCVSGGTWLPSLRKDQRAWAEILHSLQVLYAEGASANWAGVHGGQSQRRVALPTYPFQRRRHWSDAASAATGARSVDLWAAMDPVLARESARGPLDLDVASYPEKWKCLARLTDAQIEHTLNELGAFREAGSRHTLDSLMSATRIVDAQRRLIARWLDRLVDAGALRRDGDAYVAIDRKPATSLAARWSDAEASFADNRELFAYVKNCGEQLTEIVSGKKSALESLFPGGSFELATALYERSATMRYVNGLAAAAAVAACAALPPGSELRVLEIGAGTGGTSGALIRALPRDRARYRFTDVSDAFLANARVRFASDPNVEYGTFDLEIDPEAQNYAPGSFDLVVSANCVHAVKDLRAALLRLKSLLAPGGVLLLIESTTHLDYFDMTTGLIEGWQHFADDLRGNDPLLPPETWVTALLAAGMSEAKAWPERGTAADAVAQHVIVAVAPGRAAPAHARARAAEAAATEANQAAAATEQAAVGAVRRRLEEATPSEHLSILCDVVRVEVTRILRLDPSTPPARSDRLMDLGMDSLMAVQLRNSLDRAMSLERGKGLPSTLMFDYPTIEAIAEFLLARFAPAAAPSRGDDRYAKPADGPAPLDASAIAELDDEQIANLLAAREGGS